MTKLKNITRIAYKREPEKGERGAIPRIRQWQVRVRYLAGSEGETFIDFVYYEGQYYRCLTTHTSASMTNPYASVSDNNGLWDIENNFDLVATKVAFVGNGGEGWIIDNGEIRHTSGEISLSLDGSIETNSGRYRVDSTGKLICEEAEIKNSSLTDVNVQGTLRSQFVLWDSTAATFDNNDNVVVPITSSSESDGRVITSDNFSWSASNSGRIIRFVNYKWNSTVAEGKVILKAPSGKYFYENGKARTQIIVSRECLVLLGYGTPSTLYGWIVLARVDVYTNGTYGSPLKVIYQGVYNPTKDVPLEKVWSEKLMHTGIKETSWAIKQLDANGKYRVYMPEYIDSSKWHVMLTPCAFGVSDAITTNVRYATLMAKGAESVSFTVDNVTTSKYLSYFDVWTADDSSVNSGGFLFQVISMADWATPSS